MHIRGLFPTPLVIAELDDQAPLLADLRETILARAGTDPGVLHSNEGGWQSDTNFGDWGGNAAATLLGAVRAVAIHNSAVAESGRLERQNIDWRLIAWANVNRSGHANHRHYHPGAVWSGAFYVDDGGIDGADALGGAIEFWDPRGPTPTMYEPTVKMAIADCLTAGLSERFYPRAGTLVMFPSWLEHSVAPYRGTGTRISIAFNLSI